MIGEPDIRVLHVIDSLGVGGGAEHSLATMLPLLRDRGIESTIATIRPRIGGLQASLGDQGFPVEVLASTSWPGRVLALRRKIDRDRPDVVHAVLFNSCMITRLAGIGRSVPRVDSLVSTSYDTARTTGLDTPAWKMSTVRSVDGLTVRHLADRVHAVTEAVAAEAREVLGVPADRISVIPRGRSVDLLGVRSAERRRAVRTSLGIDDDVPVLLNVGRQDHPKAQADLVRAFAGVLRSHPDGVLLIAGREGDASVALLDAITATHTDASVRLLGHREDVADLYVAADLFVFPSLYEGAAGSILEAMALHTPVIGSDAASVDEVLGHGEYGVVVERGDVPALATAITDLLGDPDLQAGLADLAHRRFLDRYEIQAVADSTAAMYRSMVGHRT